jgi:hypothetical protein
MFEITTSTGEVLELDYPAWVYYISYAGETVGKYLIVKESNGNLLEINTKKDEGPSDLEIWRFVTFEIPFEKYSLKGTSCKWTNLSYPYQFHDDAELIIINSNEELENHVSCIEGSYPEIDFSKHTLLLVNGESGYCFDEFDVDTIFFRIAKKEYIMKVIIYEVILYQCIKWEIPILVPKITNEETVILDLQYKLYEK